MESNPPYQIKSFKHNGHIHRVWQENWLVPQERLDQQHAAESMYVLVNCQTKIIESDGKEWISKIPGISFFIPKEWYNIVALIEDGGIRYYCNIASPPYKREHTITYIDYDLDVIVMPDGNVHIVDQEDYEAHQSIYHYSAIVKQKVQRGLEALMQRIRSQSAPFQDDLVRMYYELWKTKKDGDAV